MVEQQKKRIEDQMLRMVEDLDRMYLRKLQGDTYKCSADCCDNDSYSLHKTNLCVQNCAIPLVKAQEYVQGEVTRVQNRLQRCIMDCNDKVKDKLGPNPTQSEVARYSDEFEQCATKCVDSYCELLPALEKTMKKVLSSKKFD